MLGKGKFKLDEPLREGIIPRYFKDVTKKKIFPIVIVEFTFRSVPERMQQGGYGYRGRVDLAFTSYALTEDEIKILKEKLEEDDLGDLMRNIEGATDESLAQIKVDLDEFLEDKKKHEEEGKDEEDYDTNPFTALFSFFKKKEDNEEKGKELSEDTREEKVLRNMAIIKARVDCKKLYGSFKGWNSMPDFR